MSFKELKQQWNNFNKTEKIWAICLLPISIPFGIVYGLLLLFWNKFGIVFLCGIGVILLDDTKTPEELYQEAQIWAFIVGIILLIRKAIKNKDS